MKSSDLRRLAGDLAPPVERFVRESRVRFALLITSSGQVLAQHGFARALDVSATATLGAGIHASTRALARMLGQSGFQHMSGAGERSQVFIGPFKVGTDELILVAVFSTESSLGLVRVFFNTLMTEVAALPGWSTAGPTTDAARFERDLEAGVERVFGDGRRS